MRSGNYCTKHVLALIGLRLPGWFRRGHMTGYHLSEHSRPQISTGARYPGGTIPGRAITERAHHGQRAPRGYRPSVYSMIRLIEYAGGVPTRVRPSQPQINTSLIPPRPEVRRFSVFPLAQLALTPRQFLLDHYISIPLILANLDHLDENTQTTSYITGLTRFATSHIVQPIRNLSRWPK